MNQLKPELKLKHQNVPECLFLPVSYGCHLVTDFVSLHYCIPSVPIAHLVHEPQVTDAAEDSVPQMVSYPAPEP